MWSVQARLFHLSAPTAAKNSKSYTRLLNYVRKVDETVQHKAGDEIIKGAMATYIFEQGEIASYQVLLAAADELGDTQAQDVLAGIMEQEVAMANWLHDHLDVLTRIYLMRDERDLQAKR